MLQVERLPEYSKHFGAIFDFQHGIAYETPPTEMVNIPSESGFATVSTHFSPLTIESFVLKEECGKAAGCSGVSAELMKPVGVAVAATLSLVAEIMFCTGLCPDAFKRANTTPFPKKANSSDISDFRPISLTEIPRRDN